MLVIDNILALKEEISNAKKNGKIVGFVPTMGALHQGHISLVKEAKKHCDYIAMSIFVNPTQFNDKNDLKNYPRTLDRDLVILKEEGGIDIVFTPDVETIYPEEDTRVFEIGRVGEVMEGKHRPGHFNGVMQVVSRLFDIVEPDKAFFGEKDFQQIAVIRAMLKITKQNVEIIDCPIKRADSGLALSSRNELLSEDELSVAPSIYRILKDSLLLMKTDSPKDTIEWVTEQLNKIDHLRVEYFEIVDRYTLESANSWSDFNEIQGCITVFCGKIRLIDNIRYK